MKKEYEYDLAIVIGRFQPYHLGHKSLIDKAYTLSNTVLVLIGSSFQPRTPVNPFTHQERYTMLYSNITENPKFLDDPENWEQEYHSLFFENIRDYFYEETKWVAQVQQLVNDKYDFVPNMRICIVGHDKDESSYYLKSFPMYDVVKVAPYIEIGEHPIDATQIRTLIFENKLTYLKGVVSPTTYKLLTTEFLKTEEFDNVKAEYNSIKLYKEQWATSPYPVTFNTTDAVVVQGGHVLLIKRRSIPGKGLWALPGGFLEQNETSEESVLRELREETKIKVPLVILRANITHRQRFDYPGRSLRGRTITEAFLIELSGGADGKLPKVVGSDDASKARWFLIGDVLEKMSEVLFEDHHSIISVLTARAK